MSQVRLASAFVPLVVLAAASVASQGRIVDVPAAGVVATGVLAGRIVSESHADEPVSRALVSVNGAATGVARTVVTDTLGRFEFHGLPPGRYDLSAAKAGYLTTSFGATRSGRRGTSVILAAGEQRTGLEIRLARGAVLAGTVFDAFGRPAPQQYVSVLRRRMSAAGWTLVPAPADSATYGGQGPWTDDLGRYRLYGLFPGEYVIVVRRPPNLPPQTFRPTSRVDIQRALRLLQSPVGMVDEAARPATGRGASGDDVEMLAGAPVYFPGTLLASSATAVSVAAGEERTGLDIHLQFARFAVVDGVVVREDGQPPGTVVVHVVSDEPETGSHTAAAGVVFPDGRFRLPPLTPGRYVIEAQTVPSGNLTELLWAVREVEIYGQDVSGVRLTLERGAHVSGLVVADRDVAQPLPRPTTTVMLVPERPLPGSWFMARPRSVSSEGGSFSAAHLAPGRYRMSAEPREPGPAGTQWRLASVVTPSGEAIETAIELRSGDHLSGVRVVLTDRGTALTGTVLDADGRPAVGYWVIAFPPDRSRWSWGSRRIAITRLDTNSEFSLNDLPEGDYLLSVLTDIDDGEQFDPRFLADLVPASVPVRLKLGEPTRQNLQITARGASRFSIR